MLLEDKKRMKFFILFLGVLQTVVGKKTKKRFLKITFMFSLSLILKASKLYVMKKPSYLTFDFKVKTIQLSEFSNLIASTIALGSSV